MKNISIMLFLIFLISCNKETAPIVNSDCQLPSEAIGNDSDLRECIIPARHPAANMQINPRFRDFTSVQEDKMYSALERLEIILNSKEFRDRVINHTYNGKKTFVDNKGLSNEEIYDVIMEGAEVLNSVVDSELDIDITLYFSNNSVVGYTYPNSERIWVNNKFFSQNSYGKVAGNVAHEWTHKIGFGHDFNRTSSRQYSVPYAVGGIVSDLVDSM